jgi:hypothetical protein
MKLIAQAFVIPPRPDAGTFFTFSMEAWGWVLLVVSAFSVGWLLCRLLRRRLEEKARIDGFLEGFHEALTTLVPKTPKAPPIKISPIKLPMGRRPE